MMKTLLPFNKRMSYCLKRPFLITLFKTIMNLLSSPFLKL